MRPTLAVFGSAVSEKNSPAYTEAVSIGKLIGSCGFDLICGGYGGLMEAVCEGCSSAGGTCSGLGLLAFSAEPNRFVQKFTRAPTLGERLNSFGKRADAYLALPGGIGTLAEVTFFWDIAKGRIVPVEMPILLYGDLWKPLLDVLRQHFLIQPSSFAIVTHITRQDLLEQELKKIALRLSQEG